MISRRKALLTLSGAAVAVAIPGGRQAWAADPIRIGFTTALTGPFNEFGEGYKRGVELALEKINASGGVLGRKMEIGMLLAQEPQLLLVDEPVAGMTDAETAQTADLLREINRTRSVVVVEHDMDFVRALGVKVTVLHEGSVLSEGTLDHVSADPKVIEVYLGR